MMDFNNFPVILVADDDPALRQTIELMLAEQGMAAHYAEDGQSAYDQALILQPDLILLDVMMPEMNGFQVCRKLREHADTQEVPIVMVTALDDRASRIKGIEAGADDFLTKPVDLLELKARVNTILRLNRYKKLQKERAQFKWAVEQAGEGYLLLDQKDHILYANPKARSYLDLTLEQELSNQVSFLKITEKQFTRYPGYLWENWRKPSKQPRYLMIPETSANRAFWLEVDVFPGPDEDPVSVVSLHNVSAAVNAEQDFKKFHYLISHKLNTPLNAVYGVVELMNVSAGEMSPEKMSELAQLALIGAERLRTDVQEILTYLRASASAPKGENFKLVHITAIASEISKELHLKPAVVRIAAAAHNRSISFSKIAFELILMELFENSRKFHPRHDPKINLIISKIDEELVSIKVIDDGLHLSVEQRAAIVEPYQQADTQRSRETEGFGLGIPMVVTILQSIGGRLNIYNSPDGPGLIVEMLVPAGVGPVY
ncbi:MAG: response regulator [Anaerolineaceae bacterium]|nr:response regulator [Anaerolineaceae bacterium]